MGRFEDSVKKIFEGKELKTPGSVWHGVENGLNADFVQQYQKRHTKNHWTTAAAILVAVLSLAFQFHPIYDQREEAVEPYSGKTYNALLANNGAWYVPSANRKNIPAFQTIPNSLVVLERIVIETENEAAKVGFVESEPNSFIDRSMASLSPELKEAEVEGAIYPYHQGGSYASLATKRSASEDKIWAGLEAGAGNFNSSVGTSNVFAGNVDQSNLASALGSDGFVNPNTEVDPNLSNGVATSLGLDVGMRLGNRWTLETGIAYTNVDSRGDASISVLDVYTVDNTEFFGSINETDLPVLSSPSRQTSIEVQESYDYELDLRSNVRFTSIPLKAGYFLMDRKMSLRLNFGLAANYFMSSQVQGENNVLNGSIDDSFNSWSFDGLGGVEIGYSVFERFDITLEPNYRQSITPLTDVSAASSRFLVQTGLRYKIQ